MLQSAPCRKEYRQNAQKVRLKDLNAKLEELKKDAFHGICLKQVKMHTKINEGKLKEKESENLAHVQK